MSYCEMPEFFSSKWVKAAKEHKCCECTATIEKGEFHGYFTGKWDGGVSSFRQHIECEDACRWIRDQRNQGECLNFGELQHVEGDYASDRSDKTLRSILARVKWREKKGRRLTFLGPYKIDYSKLRGLEEARTRGWD